MLKVYVDAHPTIVGNIISKWWNKSSSFLGYIGFCWLRAQSPNVSRSGENSEPAGARVCIDRWVEKQWDGNCVRKRRYYVKQPPPPPPYLGWLQQQYLSHCAEWVAMNSGILPREPRCNNRPRRSSDQTVVQSLTPGPCPTLVRVQWQAGKTREADGRSQPPGGHHVRTACRSLMRYRSGTDLFRVYWEDCKSFLCSFRA